MRVYVKVAEQKRHRFACGKISWAVWQWRSWMLHGRNLFKDLKQTVKGAGAQRKRKQGDEELPYFSREIDIPQICFYCKVKMDWYLFIKGLPFLFFKK